MFSIANNGQAIVSTNYWDSETERRGEFYCAPNAGAIRLLVPRARQADVNEFKLARYVILSPGPLAGGGRGGRRRVAV
jgi:hypothetical protein